MDIHLHLGAHRTGSTTFQYFLRKNREVLARNKIATYFPNETRAGMLKGIMGNPLSDPRRRRRDAASAIPEFRKFLKSLEAEGYEHLILSEENLLGSVRRNYHRGLIYPNATGQLRFLARALQDQDVRILLTMRSYDTYWSSALNYVVRWGEKVPSATKIDSIAKTPRTWRQVSQGIFNAFPDAAFKARPYEIFGGRPLSQLETLLGDTPPSGLSTNIRWHHRTQGLDELRKHLQSRGDLDSVRSLPGKGEFWFPFNKKQTTDMREVYRDDLRWAQGQSGPNIFTAIPDEKGWTDERRQKDVA